MGLLSKELPADHPIYGGDSLISTGARHEDATQPAESVTPTPVEDSTGGSIVELDGPDPSQRMPEAELEELLDELANSDPGEESWTTFWRTFKSFIDGRQAPAPVGELVILDPPWDCDLEDAGEQVELLSVMDGGYGTSFVGLYRVTNREVLGGEYRIYYEHVHNSGDLTQDLPRSRIFGYAREHRKRQGHALDREAAKRSAGYGGLVAKVAFRFDDLLPESDNVVDGPFRRFMS